MIGWLESILTIKDDELPISVDAIIGIGIDVSKDGKSSSPYSSAVALKCLELSENGLTPNILFTGGYSFNGGLTEAELMAKFIVTDLNVFVEKDSWRTYLNADYTLPIVKSHNWKKVIIVSQQWHARRVKATFKKRWADTGIQIYVVKAWSNYGGGSQSRLDYWLKFAIWDTLAFLFSKVKGFC